MLPLAWQALPKLPLRESTFELNLCRISVHILQPSCFSASPSFVWSLPFPLSRPSDWRPQQQHGSHLSLPGERLAFHSGLGFPLCKARNKSPSTTDRWNKTPRPSHKKANFASLYYLSAKAGKEFHTWVPVQVHSPL